MVGTDSIDIHALTLDELAGVVTLYPWFGAARRALCERMYRLGGEDWGERQYADQALYIPDRMKIAAMMRKKSDCTDADVDEILKALIQKRPVEAESAPDSGVRVVGGDYFSQAQYDNVREGGDSIFSRFAAKAQESPSPQQEIGLDIAEKFCTETLAQIFVEQGCYEEAKRIYSRLILDNPEKSAYFASLIEKLN